MFSRCKNIIYFSDTNVGVEIYVNLLHDLFIYVFLHKLERKLKLSFYGENSSRLV